MSLKLNQILAIEKGEKSRSYSDLTKLHKAAQKADLFNGFDKTYRKLDDDGEDYPPQTQIIRLSAPKVLDGIEIALSELFNIEASKDWANCDAKADVTVDGHVLLEDAPATFLLFLEKQLSDLSTFVQKMPTLDSAESWLLDPNSDTYKTAITSTHKSKKVQKPIVLYDATPNHPAQTQLITEDVVVGYWDTTKQSGALPIPRKTELLRRIDTMSKAVKQARTAANNTSCEKRSVASAIFGYLFA